MNKTTLQNLPELFIIMFMKMNYGNGGEGAGMDDGRFDIDVGF